MNNTTKSLTASVTFFVLMIVALVEADKLRWAHTSLTVARIDILDTIAQISMVMWLSFSLMYFMLIRKNR